MCLQILEEGHQFEGHGYESQYGRAWLLEPVCKGMAKRASMEGHGYESQYGMAWLREPVWKGMATRASMDTKEVRLHAGGNTTCRKVVFFLIDVFNYNKGSVDKKNQLYVTFCILYFSS